MHSAEEENDRKHRFNTERQRQKKSSKPLIESGRINQRKTREQEESRKIQELTEEEKEVTEFSHARACAVGLQQFNLHSPINLR